MKQPLKQHLDKLQEDGIIEKVDFPTDWISAIVVAKKSNRDIRLSLDPKPLNKALKRCKYLLPVIEEVLPELGKANVFTKVDCKNGYWQVKLNDTSSHLTTFATPSGCYKWKHMPFSIAPAGEIFQSHLDHAINGLHDVKTVADDILVIGNGDSKSEAIADHDRKLTSLLTCCRERKIKLNQAKIELKKTSIPYNGHILTSEGVRTDPSKISSITEMKNPKDKSGV